MLPVVTFWALPCQSLHYFAVVHAAGEGSVNGALNNVNVLLVLPPCRPYLLRAQGPQCSLHVLVDIAQAAGLLLVITLILDRQVLGQLEGRQRKAEADTDRIGVHIWSKYQGGANMPRSVVLASKVA